MSRRIARLAALTVVVAAPLFPVASASGTTATTGNSTVVSLTAFNAKVTSSTGHKLYLFVLATRDQFAGEGESTQLDVDLNDNRGEGHGWEGDVPNADFTHSPRNRGSITVKTKDFAKLATIHLSYRPNGAVTSKTCDVTTTRSIQPVTVTGTVDFKTHSPWGQVGSQPKSVSFTSHSTVEIDKGPDAGDCQGGFGGGTKDCDGSFGWYGVYATRGEFDAERRERGFDGPTISDMNQTSVGTTDVQLLTFDFAQLKKLALGKTASGAEKVTINAGRHGLFTGTATIVSTSTPSFKTNKKCAGKSRSWTATYTRGTRPLAVHNAIGGTYIPADNKKYTLYVDPSH